MDLPSGTRKSAAVWVTALTLIACAAVAASVAIWRSDDADDANRASVARAEQYLHPFVSTQQFMGAVLIAKGDTILLNKGYGFADLSRRTPNTPTTRFWLASLTKQFTAASILLLEERGKLRLDDPIRKYLPNMPAAWNKITIFNLLTHTSGIPDFNRGYSFSIPKTPEQLIAEIIHKPLEFSPGTSWRYSNTGYDLLGCLIERISGESYGKFLQQNIFLPLGMHDSGYDPSIARDNTLAAGYYTSKNELVPAPPLEPSASFSAGGVYSTTGDLFIWERALFGGNIISPSSLKKMTTPYGNYYPNNYALGLMVDKTNGPLSIWHGGRLPGASTRLVYYPQAKLTVIVLSNVSDGIYGLQSDEIEQNIAALAAGADLQRRFGQSTPIASADSFGLPIAKSQD